MRCFDIFNDKERYQEKMGMKNKFEKIFEQLADFHTLAGYDGWMIGACVYEQREAENQDCNPEIVKKNASFAVMRNQLELEGMHYQLELHVVKPEVQGADISRQVVIEENAGIKEKTEMQRANISRQVVIEENMGMNIEKSKPEEPQMDTHSLVKTEENTDTGVGKSISFTHSDILRFVDAVGDTNSIHRSVHAVVPGLLMVEWMLDMWIKKQIETKTDIERQEGMPDSKTFICRFRFEKPVYVDERLHVEVRNTRGKQVYECKREDKEIVWNMRIL